MALREFSLEGGLGVASYLLYLDGKAAGVIEAKKQGATLNGVEARSARCTQPHTSLARCRLGSGHSRSIGSS